MFLRRPILAVLSSAFLCILGEGTPIVDLGYAQYQGTVNTSTNLTMFVGIRYAAAPIGALRFRAPQPPPSVTGVLQATTQPNQCFQANLGTNPINPLEVCTVTPAGICLFLQVKQPSSLQTLHSLIVVWIHGGGYLNGASYQYRGTDIINQKNRGVVAVVQQYRLRIFGFLPGTAVKQNGTSNAGLRDRDFALRWVSQYISKFGGDPSLVTICGESAGGGSVLQQIVANNGKTTPQLFRGAITSSLFLPSQYNYNDRIPEVITISNTCIDLIPSPSCSAAADALACLQTVDATALETANIAINAAGFYGTWLLVPVIDGEFITQRPSLSLSQGKLNGKALLSVTNSFEGNRFVNQSTAATANATQYALDLWPNFGPAEAAKVGALYAGLGTQIFQTNAIYGESILICPTYSALQAFAGRSFKGEFAIPPATHTADALYYFPSITTDVPQQVFPPVFDNTTFRDAFAQSFTSFAISLDPNVKSVASTQTEMLFNKTESNLADVRSKCTSSTLLERCQFWNSVAALTSQ
ncbi:Alpha/Beta hydrolase protein [Mycena olivaceomarginata]|nr:Alpha/Beta hydrolase protein [Mycena olivaceomarginata]